MMDQLTYHPPFLLRFARALPHLPIAWHYDKDLQLNVLADGSAAVEAQGGAELVKTVSVIGEE
jgi:putative ATP-grasp target RiPP